MSKQRPPSVLVPVPGPVDKEKLAVVLDKLYFLGRPRLTLFHVVEVSSRTSPLNSEFFRDAINRAERGLKPLKTWLEKLGYKVSIKVVLARDVAEGIVDEVGLGGYDAVVMMRGLKRRFLRGLFHRSVSERVVRASGCPVIVVRVD